jgi:diguanylate cyclase (GGDEF)-like protein/PAS domain S-box-containing protein
MAQWHFGLIPILLFCSAGFAVLIASIAWTRRSIPESRTIALLMIALAVWSVANALEAAAAEQSTKVFWSKISYLGTHSTPPLYLVLALQFNQREKWLKARRLILLWIIPAITILLAITNEWHHLIWTHFQWAEEFPQTLVYFYGPGFWLGTGYAYLLSIIATGVLISAARSLPNPYKKQAISIILAAMIPLVGSFIYVAKINPLTPQDVSPIYFLLSSTVVTWAIYRQKFLNLYPIARSKLIDTIEDIVIVVDLQLQISDLNPAASTAIGKKNNQVVGQNIHEALTRWPVLIELLAQIQNTPTIQKTVPDRQENWYELKISPLKGRREKLQGWLIVLHDITERRELESALRTSEALYRSVIENSNDGIAIVQDEIVKYCNPQLASMLGYATEDIKGQHFSQFLAPSEAETIQERHRRRLRGMDTPANYETMLRHATGESIPVEFNISTMELDHHTAVLAMIRDIRERLNAREQINRLAAVAQQAQEAIIITDLQGCIEYTNPQFEEMTGYSVEEVKGKNPNILKSGYHDDAFYANLWNTIKSGETWVGDFINERKDGSLYHETATIFPIKNRFGTITHYAGVKRDITSQIQAEEELLKYAHQQELLNKITRATVEATDLDDALPHLANYLEELIDADDCSIRLWNSEMEKLSHLESDLNEAALEQGQPIIIEDISKSKYFPSEKVDELPYLSIWALPLVVNEEKLGTANIFFNQPKKSTDADLALARQASYQIALALFKTHLLETARKRATEAETLQQAGTAISATLDLDETIRIILEQLNRVVPYDSASVQLMRENELEIVGQRGFENPEAILGTTFSIKSENAPNHLVLDRRASLILEDAQARYEAFRNPPHDHIRGWLGVPLIFQDRIIGLIALDSTEPDRFTENHARLASAFASQVAAALENARLYEETRRLSITDPLTGIGNRRHFIELAQREFQRSHRYQRPLSLIMMDLDHFKVVNDTYGHLVGDKVLQAIAKLCENNLRESDIIGRYGGEEFLILLPETPGNSTETEANDEHTAKAVAERLRKMVESTPTQTAQGEIPITVSLGIAELTENVDDLDTLIDRADQALYQAKQSGRNQSVVWES